MPRARKKGHSKFIPALVITALAVMIGGGFFAMRSWENAEAQQEVEEAAAVEESYENPGSLTINYQGGQYRLRDDLETYLIIGLDKFTDTLSDPDAYINNQQSDFLFLMIVDKTNESYCAVHLNRDTMTEIQRLGVGGKRLGTFVGQLALSHTYGSGGKDSCRNTAEAVTNYLYGVPVDHYFAMTMDAIPVLNDLVGGVTVHVDDDFSAIDPALEQGKDVRLVGQQALTFVRARRGVNDQTNLSRMNRQREYIYGLYQQLSDKLHSIDGFSKRLASHLADFSVSDLTSTQLSNLADRMKDYRFTTIYTIPGEAVVGEKFMEFYTDDDALQELVVQLFFKPVTQ